MILASAQLTPYRENIKQNLANHYRFTEIAADQGADLILFPEMSITGYERKLAKKQAFTTNDLRLDKLRQLSVDRGITIVAGSPIGINNNLYIGAFILSPDKSISIYTKQYLHAGEDEYFKSSFDFNPLVEIKNEKVAFAICFDIENEKHIKAASLKGATVYLAGIFYLMGSMERTFEKLSGYASKYKLNVLISNFAGRVWDFDSGGKSAFCASSGELICNLDETNSGLLIIEKTPENWTRKSIILK